MAGCEWPDASSATAATVLTRCQTRRKELIRPWWAVDRSAGSPCSYCLAGRRQLVAAARPSFLGQLTPGQFETLILEPDGAIEQPRFACTAWNEVAKNVSLRPLRSRATWKNAAPHSA